MPDLLLRIIIKIVAIIEVLLSYVVVDGNLTDSKGIDIVASIASIMNNLSEFLAEFTVIFVNGTGS